MTSEYTYDANKRPEPLYEQHEQIRKLLEPLYTDLAKMSEQAYNNLKAQLEELNCEMPSNKPTKSQREEAKALRAFYRR